jgi:CDP-glucose 4,6-dehydratase
LELRAPALEDVVNEPATVATNTMFESYRGKTALVTGHNGFVGSWLSWWLLRTGCKVVGFSLPTIAGSLADVSGLGSLIESYEADVRDQAALDQVVDRHQPDIVFHLAAQALVLPSYEDPLDTFATNVMGTAHLLQALRGQSSVDACVIITSDKCYATADRPHEEGDPLGGDDPYSASKAAAELVAHAFRQSFLAEEGIGVATARAGNIVGGGDWGAHRIVPDCIQAASSGVPLELRRPAAVRPWQHVLDAVAGYLQLGTALTEEPEGMARAWNFGPDADAATTVGDLVRSLLTAWSERDSSVPPPPIQPNTPMPDERSYLTLDSSLARRELGWAPLLSLSDTVEWTVDWYWSFLRGDNADHRTKTLAQIERYEVLGSDRSAPPAVLASNGRIRGTDIAG